MSNDDPAETVAHNQDLRQAREEFRVKHPSQRLIPDEPKSASDLLIEIEERDRRLIYILAALPSPIAYEFLQSVAGNREDVSLDGIAKRCGISRRTLSRLLVNARSVARGDTPPPGIGSSKKLCNAQSTRRGRAHRATDAKNNKKGDKK